MKTEATNSCIESLRREWPGNPFTPYVEIGRGGRTIRAHLVDAATYQDVISDEIMVLRDIVTHEICGVEAVIPQVP